MTLLTGVACVDQSSCMKDCNTKLKSSKRFNLAVQKELVQREMDEAHAFDRLRADEQRRYEAELKDADLAYQLELQAALDKLAKAEEAMAAARQHVEDTQRLFEELKHALGEAPVKVETAITEYNRTKEEFYEAKKAALGTYEYAKGEAGNRSAETAAEAERRAQELHKKSAAREQRFAKLADDHPVPDACRGDTRKQGAFAAVQCCCSVGGVPITVDHHFLDWGRCKSPKKYERSGLGKLDFVGLTACSPYQECAKCRELVCGKGMCPQ